MRRVYLDFMAWVDLAKAAEGRPRLPSHEDALTIARHGVANRLLEFPLSAIHYMELLQQPLASRREPIGRLMVELSRLRTMAGPDRIVDEEIDRALKHHFGRPTTVRSQPVFGQGMGHALGVDQYRFHVPDGLAITEEARRFVEDLGSDLVERAILAGPAQEFGIGEPPGTKQVRELVSRHASQEAELGELMRSEGYKGERLRDAWLARGITEAFAYINPALERAGVPWSALTANGKDGLTKFFLDIPVLSTYWELRFLRHQNPQATWSGNDLRDLIFLSVATVHCDIVVTERHWHHMLTRTGRPARFGTVVEHDLSRLSTHLVQAA